MPYRYGAWFVLVLLPAILIAFWPGYFGQLRAAPMALHGHGISATAWLILLAFQLWSIHARRPALHRTAGLLLFVVVPLFAGASLAALQGGIALFAVESDPFHATFSARLAMVDIVALATFVWLTWYALARRRDARTHAAALLATAILVLPPILGRLVPIIPGFAAWDVAGRSGFTLAFYLGEMLATGVALALYRTDRAALAFLVVILSNLIQCLSFETLAATDGWTRLAVASLAIPTPLLVIGGIAVTAAILFDGWRRVPPRRPVRAAPSARAT